MMCCWGLSAPTALWDVCGGSSMYVLPDAAKVSLPLLGLVIFRTATTDSRTKCRLQTALVTLIAVSYSSKRNQIQHCLTPGRHLRPRLWPGPPSGPNWPWPGPLRRAPTGPGPWPALSQLLEGKVQRVGNKSCSVVANLAEVLLLSRA